MKLSAWPVEAAIAIKLSGYVTLLFLTFRLFFFAGGRRFRCVRLVIGSFLYCYGCVV